MDKLVYVLVHIIFNAVDQSLVEVENYRFLNPCLLKCRQLDPFSEYLFNSGLFKVEFNVLKRLESLYKMHFVSI